MILSNSLYHYLAIDEEYPYVHFFEALVPMDAEEASGLNQSRLRARYQGKFPQVGEYAG